MMIQEQEVELLNRISAMHTQEMKISRCHNYFQKESIVDESCRTAMVDWLVKISDALYLNRETVGIAVSLLDRSLSSDVAFSTRILGNNNTFQLAAVTSFYIAVKLNEPVPIGLSLFVKFCRGCYTESDISSMELEILFSLNWQVSSPTPIDFLRHFIDLLPASMSKHLNTILSNALHHMNYILTDIYFSSHLPSLLGASCLAVSLKQTMTMSFSDQLRFFEDLSHVLEFDVSKEFEDLQLRLFLRSPDTEQPYENVQDAGSHMLSCSVKSTCSDVHYDVVSSPVSTNKAL